MADLKDLHAGDHAGALWRRGRRLDTYAVDLGGGLLCNVANGTVVSFGLEPVGPVVGRRRHLSTAVAWAAPLGAVAAAGAAVATGIVLRHRHAA
jgi:hypothetical protein